MPREVGRLEVRQSPMFIRTMTWAAIAGCISLTASILIADFVVPDHDWIADTISDLGAGKYEFIVDIGIYAFSASFLAVALLAAHIHLGEWRWSVGIAGLAMLALIVFLVGARNEYGDADHDGWVIHIYLVYATGLLVALVPWSLADGAARVASVYGKALKAISIVWALSAPVFFFLPTEVDGIYERYLGLLAIALVAVLSHLFTRYARNL